MMLGGYRLGLRRAVDVHELGQDVLDLVFGQKLFSLCGRHTIILQSPVRKPTRVSLKATLVMRPAISPLRITRWLSLGGGPLNAEGNSKPTSRWHNGWRCVIGNRFFKASRIAGVVDTVKTVFVLFLL